MICFDRPFAWDDRRSSTHLYSDKPGPAGTAELLAFAHTIGVRPEWLQESGTAREHFDLFGVKIRRAADAGATEVSHGVMARHIKNKQRRMVAA